MKLMNQIRSVAKNIKDVIQFSENPVVFPKPIQRIPETDSANVLVLIFDESDLQQFGQALYDITKSVKKEVHLTVLTLEKHHTKVADCIENIVIPNCTIKGITTLATIDFIEGTNPQRPTLEMISSYPKYRKPNTYFYVKETK